MPSLTSTLQIATKGLLTSQTALSTVSHNIANVNTEGFARQRVIAQSDQSLGFGDGASILNIERVIDNLLVKRISSQKSLAGFNEARASSLRDIEVIFGVPDSETSMEKVLNKLFNDMNLLSNASDSSSLKLNVVQSAGFVVDTLNKISLDIQTAQNSIDTQIDNELTTINSAIEKIFDLNNEIVRQEQVGINGANANDLKDERQRQIDIIARRVGVNITEDPDGRVRLITESGRRLVDTSFTRLERIAGTPFADIGVRPILTDGTPSNTVFPIIMANITSGSIKGAIEVRDTIMPDVDTQVDNLATVMIREFNRIHSKGTGVPPQNSFLTGNGANISAAGADLFLPTELGLTGPASFDISVVDPVTGAPVNTTLAAGGGTTSIAIPAAGPFSLNDLAVLINGNPDVGAVVTATVTVDALGNPALQIAANNPAQAVVLANNVGNPLGELGFNNFFTGTDASDIGIRADIVSNPSLVATARMRVSDGGLSLNDNQNAIELAQMADTEFSYAAAGTLGAQSDSIAGYFITITSNVAVTLQDSSDRSDFSQTILTDLEERFSSISGVNMDEELGSLLLFQNSFQASARIMRVVDEMMEELVNLV